MCINLLKTKLFAVEEPSCAMCRHQDVSGRSQAASSWSQAVSRRSQAVSRRSQAVTRRSQAVPTWIETVPPCNAELEAKPDRCDAAVFPELNQDIEYSEYRFGCKINKNGRARKYG